MSDSIKRQIIARALALLQPPVAAGTVRQAIRRSTLLLLEPILPSIHLVVGHDVEQDHAEDNAYFYFQFPLFIKIIFSDWNTALDTADALEAAIAQAIEADYQLAQLAIKIVPHEVVPFVQEVNQPSGGVILTYLVDYRRRKGDPYQT